TRSGARWQAYPGFGHGKREAVGSKPTMNPWILSGISSGTVQGTRVMVHDDRRSRGEDGDCLIRVLVSAKSAIEQAGLESIVRTGSDFELTASGTRARDILAVAREAEPDVILVDGPDVAVTRLLTVLSTQAFAPPLILLVESAARAEVQRLLQSGVRGLMLRDSEPQEILAALRAVRDGLAVVSPEILDVLLPVHHETGDAEEFPPAEPLTARESEVLGLLAAGAGNK